MAKNLYSTQQYIKKANSFKSYIQKIKKSDDFTIVKERLVEAIDTMLAYLNDLKYSIDNLKQINTHETLLVSFKNTIEVAKNCDDLITVTSLLDLLDQDQFRNFNEYSLTNMAYAMEYNDRDAFVNISKPYLEILRKTINNESLNMFFPNCQNGNNVKNFATSNDKTYGQTDRYTMCAKEILDRVAKGVLKGSIITNNYFDVLFLVSRVGYRESVDHLGVVKEPNERIEIKNVIKYLRPDGLFLITIPYTRLLPSLAMYLSKNLSNVQVVKVPDDELKRVTIIGTKNKDNSVSNKEIYQMLKLFDYNQAIDMTELESGMYNLPTEELVLEMFRGSELDCGDVLEACQDNMLNSFIDSQMDPLVVKDQAPLLPFNIGQIGLVLTSGCLDGVIEEMEGINHIIKGMTTKVISTNREDLEDNKVKCTETINNQVKINIFTADGKFIQLG